MEFRSTLLDTLKSFPKLLLPPRWMIPSSIGLLVLWLFGGPLGRLAAFCAVPRLFRIKGSGPDTHRPALDALWALLCGLFLAAACHLLWAPQLIYGGETLASDVGEHFWLLHSLSSPGWDGWSINRYPVPALFARMFAFGAFPHDCWYRAAIASMAVLGGSIFIWARAIGGRGAGLAAVLLVGAFPDLVLMVRTATGYPEQAAFWTLAAGLAAYAVRFPSIATCALAGSGAALAFSSDTRGLFVGLAALGVGTIAAFSRGALLRRVARLLALLLPVLASWYTYHALPLEVRGLEQMLEASIEASYRRLGEPSPERVHLDGGYNWGQSGPRDLPRTFEALWRARARMNPEVITSREQLDAVNRRVYPYVLSVALLAFAALIIGPGFPSLERVRKLEAWLEWFDWRAKVGLTAVFAFLLIWFNAVTYEYSERYAGLGTPGLVILAGVGLSAIAGRRTPAWITAMIVAGILYLVPGPLSSRAAWKTPTSPPSELTQCLLLASDGDVASPDNVPEPVRICVEAQRVRVDKPVVWPF